MAWRIDTYVIRGEIDNRQRNRVLARVWIAGRKNPIEIELKGNASRDLAGRRITFTNPLPKIGLAPAFSNVQRGYVGYITASRKVRVPDAPVESLTVYGGKSGAQPSHWANGLYFEWYSEANGRVVIESTDFFLSMDTDITWDMTAEEELKEREKNMDGLQGFLDRLQGVSEENDDVETPLIQIEEINEKPLGWPEDRPMTEEEADALMADSDRLTERLLARLRDATENDDLEAILEEEIEAATRESAFSPLSEDERERESWIDELKRRADEIIKLEIAPNSGGSHPLSARASALSLALHEDLFQGGAPDADEIALRHAVTHAAGKLSGALDGRAWPLPLKECGLCIAWLKRARFYYDQAARSAALSRKRDKRARDRIDYFYGEILSIRAEIETLIDLLRDRLAQGWE